MRRAGELGVGEGQFQGRLRVVAEPELGSVLESGGGAADLAEQRAKLRGMGDIDAGEISRGEVSVGLEHVDRQDRAESEHEELELLKQGVVGGLTGDIAPMGFEQFEVGNDGGVRDAEGLADLAQGGALLTHVVSLEDALPALGGDVHGRAFPRLVRTEVLLCIIVCWICVF